MSRRSSTGSSSRGRRGAAGGGAPRAASRRRAKGGRDGRGAGGARILHLDPFSGIAGNMLLGALLDLGLPRRELEADLAGLGLEHRLVVRRVRRGALAAKYVDVRVPGGGKGHGHGRSYAAIRRILERARLDASVRERALTAFELLARAEARVHGIALAKVHFHEVGAVDAIVDVTGAAIGMLRLGVERITCGTVALGEGRVETEHGALPLPAPATLELLRGVPCAPAHVAWETVTPTGAALLRTWVDDYCVLPAMTVEAAGYGAGEDRAGELPNLLRAVLGRGGGAGVDRVICLETNLDDLVPEHFAFLMERLFEAGALDVSLQPLQMKKNRPGILVRVLARPADKHVLAQRLFAESTAIGVRVAEMERVVLPREQRRVETPYGRIGVKVVWDLEGRETVSAEVDDCARAARRHGVTLREVVRAAEESARR